MTYQAFKGDIARRVVAVVVRIEQEANGFIVRFLEGVDQMLRLLGKLRIDHDPALFGGQIGDGAAFFGENAHATTDGFHLVGIVGQ